MAFSYYDVQASHVVKHVKELWSVVGGREVETWVISEYDYK